MILSPFLRTVFKVTAILAVVILLSAFLAPILFEHLPIRFKFERIFNRLVMIFTLVSVAIFVRFKKPTLSGFGILWSDKSLEHFLKGCAIAVGVLVVAVSVKIGAGVTMFQPRDLTPDVWISRVIKIILSALLIGVIEEFFFRGYLYRQLRDKLTAGCLHSVLWTNLFYAVVHFLGDDPPFIGPDPTFFDSLKLVAAPFKTFGNWRTLWPSFLGLFLFGVILTRVTVLSGSLYGAIGMHAGCVFFLKLDGSFIASKPAESFIWGTDNIYDGIIGWLFLGIMLVLSEVVLRKSKDGLVH